MTFRGRVREKECVMRMITTDYLGSYSSQAEQHLEDAAKSDDYQEKMVSGLMATAAGLIAVRDSLTCIEHTMRETAGLAQREEIG